MESSAVAKPLKLNYKRTMLIGFAFFGILLLWQVYDSWCPTLLTQLFKNSFGVTDEKQVQYLVGVMMAIDNLAALILLPIFGRLSDKTRTPIGKRMPYILAGTAICAIAFPFIPLFYHWNNVAGVISMMLITVIFAMMYRNPAVALMPDVTPKPLRSKANGIINIMGYIGGAFATVLGIFFVLSDYLGTAVDKSGNPKPFTWAHGNVWAIEAPFLIGAVLMVISAVVLFFTVRENELEAKLKEEMERGEDEAEVVDRVSEDAPLSKANRNMLLLILGAEFFWFMADNGISTFMVNYTVYLLKTSTASAMVNTIVGGVGSVLGFALGGIIASKIGRKWTLLSGLLLSLASYAVWAILTFTVGAEVGKFPIWLYVIWFIKGFGMSLVHVNSYPMVVELCPNSKIGRYTGYYYAASMAAQTITPIALGSLLLIPSMTWEYLPIYGAICLVAAVAIFFFVKNVKSVKTSFKKGLEAMDTDE